MRGKDYEYDGSDAALPHAAYPMKGVGPFTHTDPRDRPPEIFGGVNTLHFGASQAPYLLLPSFRRGRCMSIVARSSCSICIGAAAQCAPSPHLGEGGGEGLPLTERP